MTDSPVHSGFYGHTPFELSLSNIGKKKLNNKIDTSPHLIACMPKTITTLALKYLKKHKRQAGGDLAECVCVGGKPHASCSDLVVVARHDIYGDNKQYNGKGGRSNEGEEVSDTSESNWHQQSPRLPVSVARDERQGINTCAISFHCGEWLVSPRLTPCLISPTPRRH